LWEAGRDASVALAVFGRARRATGEGLRSKVRRRHGGGQSLNPGVAAGICALRAARCGGSVTLR
jgi:hypothetical protein